MEYLCGEDAPPPPHPGNISVGGTFSAHPLPTYPASGQLNGARLSSVDRLHYCHPLLIGDLQVPNEKTTRTATPGYRRAR